MIIAIFNMKYLYILFIYNLSFCQTKSYSEAYNESNIYRVTLELDCENINALVETDISNKCIFLFLQGGIAPVRYNTDKQFEKKYNLHYYEQGCIGNKCSENYNYIIFDYLLKTYGKKWMKEIRKDALGFQEWKKTYKKNIK